MQAVFNHEVARWGDRVGQVSQHRRSTEEAVARRRLANPDRFASNTISGCCRTMNDLLPRDIYDVCWGEVANDFGVFQVSAELIRTSGFPRLLDTNLATIPKIERALALLTKGGQWLAWVDRTSKLRWAIFPRWGDEQTIGNPSPNRDPVPPDRILAKCSLKTREFYAKFSRTISGGFAPDNYYLKEGVDKALEEGEGVQGEGSGIDPELLPLVQQLHSVMGYQADVPKDVDMLVRAVGLYGIALVRHVVGSWVLRRQDDPLKPKARPRVELWNWFRIQKGWDGDRSSGSQAAPRESAAKGWTPG